mmetsp:Transcript_8181/g.37018  ORF Transcript_8181/g.37018 Transcript_8181/m.37018 type:complete len:232 (+) Transcript_8181:1310-2005(+)
MADGKPGGGCPGRQDARHAPRRRGSTGEINRGLWARRVQLQAVLEQTRRRGPLAHRAQDRGGGAPPPAKRQRGRRDSQTRGEPLSIFRHRRRRHALLRKPSQGAPPHQRRSHRRGFRRVRRQAREQERRGGHRDARTRHRADHGADEGGSGRRRRAVGRRRRRPMGGVRQAQDRRDAREPQRAESLRPRQGGGCGERAEGAHRARARGAPAGEGSDVGEGFPGGADVVQVL